MKRLVILGEYDVSVRKGQVTLLGATLGPSDSFHRVFALSTHSLPVLRCLATDTNDAEVKLRQCDSGLIRMESLSSLFGKLWNDNSGPLGSEYSSLLKENRRSTFQIVGSLSTPTPS
jgi:polynucleotide 5'-hydroxyl-kinase GRC3/NOL9